MPRAAVGFRSEGTPKKNVAAIGIRLAVDATEIISERDGKVGIVEAMVIGDAGKDGRAFAEPAFSEFEHAFFEAAENRGPSPAVSCIAAKGRDESVGHAWVIALAERVSEVKTDSWIWVIDPKL